MPLYEYICNKCKIKEERLLSFSKSDSTQLCNECNKPLIRIISKPSFQLKGSGWYSDHYGLKPKTGDKNGQSKKSN